MEEKTYKYQKRCNFCDKSFKTNSDEYLWCYSCFRFFMQFGRIKDYKEFLEAFELKESQETREEYIKFVDNLKKFLDIKGDWKTEKILENPGKFLDKINIGEKRKKK